MVSKGQLVISSGYLGSTEGQHARIDHLWIVNINKTRIPGGETVDNRHSPVAAKLWRSLVVIEG